MQKHLKVNIAVNLLARVWNALISFAFVPVYIYFIGAEGYGFISLYTTLVALFALLDFGLSMTVNREVARFGDNERGMARSLLRTFEAVYWAIATVIALSIALLSGYIVHEWITLDAIPLDQAQRGVMLMGAVALVRWPAALYLGVLLGMQRQVIANVITSVAATAAALGAALVLWQVAPRVDLFVGWQLVVFLIQIVALRIAAWHVLALPGDRPHFRLAVLRERLGFSAGVTGITLLSLILTQLDKVLLTRMLSLQEFGYYSIAASIAGILTTAGAAVQTAAFPALTSAVEQGDKATESATYHHSSRSLAVLVLPAAVTLALFAPELLAVYLHDAVAADRTHLLLSLLAVGNAFLALVFMPLSLQLAHGWTSLSMYKNVVAVAIYVPALLFLVPHYGATGAACAWLALTAGYFLLEVPVMHRRLLRGAMGRWYLVDLGIPALVALGIMGLTRLALPADFDEWMAIALIVTAGVVAQLGCFLLLPSAPATAMRLLASVTCRPESPRHD